MQVWLDNARGDLIERNCFFIKHQFVCFLNRLNKESDPRSSVPIIPCLKKYGTSNRRSRWWVFGQSTGKDVSCHYFCHFFISSHSPTPCFPVSSDVCFSQKIYFEKLMGEPKNLGVNPFPDSVKLFGAPWCPFLILQAVRCCRH